MKEISTEELKRILVNMMVDIDEYCEKNNITYYLAYGTLLGAVRHKGFIPWDDDIDIMMPRADYEKFVSSFNNSSSHAKNIEVIDHLIEKDYYHPFAKVIQKETEVEECINSKLHIGVFIDVFPLDYLPGNLGIAKKKFQSLSLYRLLLDLKNMKTREGRSILKNFVVVVGNALMRIIPRSFLINSIDKKAREITSKKDSLFIANIAFPIYSYKEIMPVEWLKTGIKADFEGHKLFIPSGYHQVLSQLYGDYMKLPPVEKRVTHHGFKAWWKDS